MSTPRSRSGGLRRSIRLLSATLVTVLAVGLTGLPASGRSDEGRVLDHSLLRLHAAGGDDGVTRVPTLPMGDDARARLLAGRVLRARLTVGDATLEAGVATSFRTQGSRARRGLRVLRISYGDGSGIRSRKLTVARSHSYPRPGTYVATLVVKDRTGRRATSKRTVLVRARATVPPSDTVVTPVDQLGFGAEPPLAEDEVGIEADVAPGAGDGAGAPASVDLRGSAMAVQNQGDVNSCVAWTTAYGLVGWYYRQKYGQSVPFAPMYVYSQTYLGLDAAGKPSGSYAKDALEVLRTQGVDTAAHYGAGWASTWNTRPNAAQTANAASYRISGWDTIFRHAGSLGGDTVGTTPTEIEALKGRLAAGQPVAIAFRVRQDFNTYRSGWYAGTGALTNGLHEMLALGYDANGLFIQNSWGTDRGVGGYVYMTWDAVRRDLYEATFAHGLVASSSGGGDSVSPTITSFSKQFAVSYVANNAQAPMTFSWGGTDNVGVSKYVLYYRADGGDWLELPIGDTQTSVTYNLAFGSSYQFAVAAYDAAGNLSDWSLSAQFTPQNYAESVAAYAGSWTSYSDAAYMNGQSYESSQANAQMTVQVTGTNFGLVGTQGPQGGRAYVYLDGTYQFTIDNYRATAGYRTVVAWFNFGSSSTHTVRVVVEGTAGRPYVGVDSFLLS